MAINPLRHLAVFSPAAFGERRVDVIGVGATGSRIAMSVAKLGVTNLHVWDGDTIAPHNIANQLYDVADIGANKAEAIGRRIKAATGTQITVHPKHLESQTALGQYAFLLVDSFETRRAIVEHSLQFNVQTNLVIETRLGIDVLRVYCFNPNRREELDAWLETLYAAPRRPANACASPIAVGPTADVVAGIAVWQFIRQFSYDQGGEDRPEFEAIMGVRPPAISMRRLPHEVLV